MATIKNHIERNVSCIFLGDLVDCDGDLGIFSSYGDKYYIVGFNGKILKDYGYLLSAIDEDPTVRLICRKDNLIISLSKKYLSEEIV